MLGISSGLNMTWASLSNYTANNIEQSVWQCSVGNGFSSWMGVQIGIFFIVMLLGAWVAFKTRSVPSAFNESNHMLFSLQILMVFLILLVPLDWALLSNSPEAAVVIQSGGQLLLALFLLLSNFLPKIYYIFTGACDDVSMIYPTQAGSPLSSGFNAGSKKYISNNTAANSAINSPTASKPDKKQTANSTAENVELVDTNSKNQDIKIHYFQFY